MPRRTTHKRIGAPTALTEDRAATILEAVEHGNHLTTACNLAGVGKASLYRWLHAAAMADEAILQGRPYPHDHDGYRDFRDRLAVARARAEANAIAVVQRAMEGGAIKSEEPVLDDNGNAQYDGQGNVLWRRTYTAPDGRLAMTYLARSAPDRWGDKQQVEVVTPEMRPVLDEPDNVGSGQFGLSPEALADVLGLASRLALTQRKREAGWDDVEEPVADNADDARAH